MWGWFGAADDFDDVAGVVEEVGAVEGRYWFHAERQAAGGGEVA